MTVDSGGGTEDTAWSLTNIEVLGAEIQNLSQKGKNSAMMNGPNSLTVLSNGASFQEW